MPYRPHAGESDTFARSKRRFAAATMGKTATADDSGRQARFERELTEIAGRLGSPTIPVFIDFAGEPRRMDKGCVGHAIARGFICQLVDGPAGMVDSVTLARRT